MQADAVGRGIAVALAALVALLLAGCTNLFFSPARELWRTPGDLGLAYDDVSFATADGETLHGWFLPAKVGPGSRPVGTVLFLHGRSRNIASQIASVDWLPARGFNVFLFDYRGYGSSTGTPSLAGLQQDLDAGWQAMLARPEVDRDRIVVFGQSMGAALALHHVSNSRFRTHVRAMITEGAFTGYRDAVRDFLEARGGVTGVVAPWLSYLVEDDYSPLQAVKSIAPIPLLIVHGEKDGIVPIQHAKALFEAAGEPKELWIVPASWHVGSFRPGRDENKARLARFLQRALEVTEGAPSAARR